MEDLTYLRKKTNLGISLAALVKSCQHTPPTQLHSQTLEHEDDENGYHLNAWAR